jgi:hypothetical protein
VSGPNLRQGFLIAKEGGSRIAPTASLHPPHKTIILSEGLCGFIA